LGGEATLTYQLIKINYENDSRHLTVD